MTKYTLEERQDKYKEITLKCSKEYYQRHRKRLDDTRNIRKVLSKLDDITMEDIKENYDMKDEEQVSRALEYVKGLLKIKKAMESKERRNENKWKIQCLNRIRARMINQCKKYGIDFDEFRKNTPNSTIEKYCIFRKMMKVKYDIELPSIEYESEGRIMEKSLENNEIS